MSFEALAGLHSALPCPSICAVGRAAVVLCALQSIIAAHKLPEQFSPALPAYFEMLPGGHGRAARFVARIGQGRVLVEDQAITMQTGGQEVRLRFLGAAQDASFAAIDEQLSRVNYLFGNDPASWVTGVRQFAGLKLEGGYPGIDTILRATGRNIEYDFLLAPHADSTQIKLSFRGQTSLALDANGDLLLATSSVTLRHRRPVAYQITPAGRNEVRAQFHILSSTAVGIRLGDYDSSYPLTIDPVLDYSTYLGGASDYDSGETIAVDSGGNVYVAGTTTSTDFPRTPGTLAVASGNMFISKLSPSGRLVFSTVFSLGTPNDIALDSVGNIYLTGWTYCQGTPAFATTPGALRSTCPDKQAGFVLKLSSTGDRLLYSSLLGSSEFWGAIGLGDAGKGLAIDASGAFYVAGVTYSSSFPLSPPSLYKFRNLGAAGSLAVTDGFVIKFDAGGKVVFSTLLGGSSDDTIYGIAIDSQQNVYVSGSTTSTDFPVLNPLQPMLRGNAAVFVAKIKADGSGLGYSTFLGESALSGPRSIAVDSSGSAYVAAIGSPTFPIGSTISSAGSQARMLIVKLNPSGERLMYSLRFGGYATEIPNRVRIDSKGNLYIAGLSRSSNFPSVGEIGTRGCGEYDRGFLAKINLTVSGLVYSTLLGSATFGQESAVNDIAVDTNGTVYVTGYAPNGFPLRNAERSQVGGRFDAFVARLSDAPDRVPPSISLLTMTGPLTASGGNVSVTADVADDVSVASVNGRWIDPTGHEEALQFSRVETYNPNGCQPSDYSRGAWVATFPAAPNFTPTDQQYRVIATVTDASGNVSNSAQALSRVPGRSGNTPFLEVTVPPYGNYGSLSGVLRNGNPALYNVAVLLFVSGAGWFSKPFCNQTMVDINSDGTWSALVTTGGTDGNATQFAVYLLPKSVSAGCYLNLPGLPADLEGQAITRVLISRPDPNERTLSFAGFQWSVSDAFGPDGNRFLKDLNNAWVDDQGRLHLRVVNINNRWYGAEVISKRVFGYGTFRWFVDSRLDDLDPNIVAGLFTWSDGEADHREIDIEFSRFGDAQAATNGQYVIQPFTNPLNLNRYKLPPTSATTHSFDWRPDKLAFQSFNGKSRQPPPNGLISEWQFNGLVPQSGNQAVRMNVWLLGQQAPLDKREFELIISGFEFIPTIPSVTADRVLNAASFDSGIIAPGEIITILGSGFGTTAPAAGDSAPTGQLPESLSGVRVSFDGVSAPLMFVREDQINALVPSSIATRPLARLQVDVNGAKSEALSIPVSPSAPGVFTVGQNGRGQGAVLNQDNSRNSVSNPARRGTVIQIFATGAGTTTPSLAPGEPAAATGRPLILTDVQPTVLIGGIPAAVQFSGMAPGFAGLWQINAQIPQNVTIGPAVPLTIRAVNSSNTTSIAVQ